MLISVFNPRLQCCQTALLGANFDLFWTENFFGRKNFRPNVASTTADAEVFFFLNHFKKICPEGKFFEMLSWGGLGGRSPPRNLRYPCLAPVPCPQFIFVQKVFRTKNFRPKIFRSKICRPKKISVENVFRSKKLAAVLYGPYLDNVKT